MRPSLRAEAVSKLHTLPKPGGAPDEKIWRGAEAWEEIVEVVLAITQETRWIRL